MLLVSISLMPNYIKCVLICLFSIYLYSNEMSVLKYLSDNSRIFVILMMASIGFFHLSWDFAGSWYN